MANRRGRSEAKVAEGGQTTLLFSPASSISLRPLRFAILF